MSDNGCIAVQRSSLLAVFLLAVFVLAPLGAYAENGLTISISAETYETQFTLEVYNASMSLAANTSQTINVTLPNNWSQSDIEYVLVHVNTDAPIQLSAVANGSVVATADVVPLSSGYTVTLPMADQIQLAAASQAATAQVQVYLVTKPANFSLSLATKSVNLYSGDTQWLEINVKQLDGPRVFVYFSSAYNYNISGFNAQVFKNDKTTPYEGAVYGVWTSGAGWNDTAYLRLYWDGSGQETNLVVKIILYADPDGPDGPVRPMSVAVVDLSGSITDTIASLTQDDNNAKYLGLGAGVVVGLVLALLFLGGQKRGGRRGQATGMAPVVLILVVLAAIGLSLGLLDFDTRFNIDPKFLGIGILAVLALIMMIKQGTVPAPRAVKKLFR